MLDSDTDPRKAMEDASKWLSDAGFVAPNGPFQWTNHEAEQRTAVLLMPGLSDEGEPREGTLEHLLWDVLKDVAPDTFECVEEFASCLGGQADWSENKRAKMRVRAAIAGCCDRDPASSLAWIWSKDASIFPLDHSMFDFIGNLFQDLITSQ